MDPQERESLNALFEQVLGAAFEVSNTLGAGFLEKVYRRAMVCELGWRGLPAAVQVSYQVSYKGQEVGQYMADLVVDQRLLVELKCAERLTVEHLAQTINYLRASGLHLGLLLNFGKPRVEWRRVVHQF
jgi:GxxExxY protein